MAISNINFAIKLAFCEVQRAFQYFKFFSGYQKNKPGYSKEPADNIPGWIPNTT
jgi:hypothetical protein